MTRRVVGSKRALIIERLREHPSRSQTANEIARALGLSDGRAVAMQLKWMEREGIVRTLRGRFKTDLYGASEQLSVYGAPERITYSLAPDRPRMKRPRY